MADVVMVAGTLLAFLALFGLLQAAAYVLYEAIARLRDRDRIARAL